MSSTYNLEPPPTAKVLLKTTQGDLVLEIFAKQIPLASRNFLQHCLDGYYDNTVFHRLVPGFILQGGDPTGLGTGGVSTFEDGKPFADEFHSRLRFNRRGLLGMANTGEANDNTSQFFLTLDKTPELEGKNTMFGRIEGDTIYNLMQMSEAELAEEGGDRPLYPAKVTGAEILVNPFEGMVKRVTIAPRTQQEKHTGGLKKKRKATKTLLSFDDDDGASSAPIKRAKVAPVFRVENPEPTKIEKDERPVEATRPRSPARATSPLPARVHAAKIRSPSPAPVVESPQVEVVMTALERTNQQIAALKQSMKRNTASSDRDAEQSKKKSALEELIPANAIRGRKKGAKALDGANALADFKAFKAKLGAMNSSEFSEPLARIEVKETKLEAGEEKLCDLHFIANCQSCTAWDEDDAEIKDVDDEDTSWLGHSLSFAKDVLGKDLEWKRKMEGLEEFDPRAQQDTDSRAKIT